MTAEQLLRLMFECQPFLGKVVDIVIEPYAPQPDGTRKYAVQIWEHVEGEKVLQIDEVI